MWNPGAWNPGQANFDPYGFGRSYGAFSPEERDYLLQNMPDLSSQEEELKKQEALSEALRVPMTRRMDAASQASRAISGIGSAYADYDAAKRRKTLGGTYRDVIANMPKPGQQREDDASGGKLLFSGGKLDEDDWA